MDEPGERELLERARAGDREVLELLLSKYEPRVYRFGMKLCRDPEDAKDVVQETLLAMARSVRDFRGASSVSTWLYSIARSFCIKKRRRSKFAPAEEASLDAPEGADAVAVADPKSLPDAAAAGRQIEAALEGAIRALDPEYREILLLRDVEGLTAPEVAEVTGLSVAAVKSRLHRARVRVRDRVAPLLGIEDVPPGTGPCVDVLTMYSQFLEGEISAATCAEMEEHVSGCDRCRAACDSLKRTLALCKASPTPTVPTDVQEAVRRSLREALGAG